MNNGLILLFMLVLGCLLGGIPFAYMKVVEMAVGLEFASSTTAIVGLIFVSLVVMYLGSLGACAATQNSNCGGVKDMKAVAQDAAIAMAIQCGFLLIGAFVPYLNTMMSKYFVGTPIEKTPDALWAKSIDLGFWGGWGAAYGIAVGATLAGSC
jgi:hypothetical protein